MEKKSQDEHIDQAAQHLAVRGFAVAGRGLVSVESRRRRYLITPPGKPFAELTADALVIVGCRGKTVDRAMKCELDAAMVEWASGRC